MKAESNVKPAAPFEILPFNNEEVEVLFYKNTITIPATEEDVEKYSYDYYRLIVKKRENLKALIETSLNAWIELAKDNEAKESIHAPTQEDRLAILEDTMNFVLGL